MKRIVIILFILSFATPSLAATVGGPELSIPEESLYLKRKAVNRELDRLEFNTNIKAGFDIEITLDRDLSTSSEVTNAEIEGVGYMFKISNNFYDLVEPYIRIGTSNFEVNWNQNSNSITVESKTGFTWGLGVKAKLWEFKDYGVKLTLDAQYRKADLDVDSINLSNATDDVFEIEEWQIGVLASKKFILPIGLRDYYVVPYAGLTFSSSDFDVSFTDSSNGLLYSLYNADNEEPVGIVLGFDVMPSLLSWYLFNFELRLINETAFSLGGTIKF